MPDQENEFTTSREENIKVVKPGTKAKRIIIGLLANALGIFLTGWGAIAMFFNFHVGLAASVVGILVIYFYWYIRYKGNQKITW